jgi:hypothetical protein
VTTAAGVSRRRRSKRDLSTTASRAKEQQLLVETLIEQISMNFTGA